MRLPKGVRLVLGAAAVLASIVLSWALEEYVGPISLMAVLPGAGLFVCLNPELISGK
ncbi:hypothetical protein CE91St43_06650 [Oscillospiraceae bacterium]|nr:hypothetical protein CE91St43_06650 [Oscillospiraceae bacterium]